MGVKVSLCRLHVRVRNTDACGWIVLDAPIRLRYSPAAVGDELQGAAADCNSAEETRAWFDSRVAHQTSPRPSQETRLHLVPSGFGQMSVPANSVGGRHNG